MRERVILVKRYVNPHKKKGGKFNWQLRWWDSDGNRHSKSVARSSDLMGKRKAEHALQQKRRELETSGGKVPAKIPFDEFMESHLETVKPTVRNTSYREIDFALRLFFKKVHPEFVQDVDFTMAERFFKIVSVGRRRATINKYLTTLKRVFELAVHRGIIDTNPFKQIRRPKTSQRDRQWYKPDSLPKILDAAPNEFYKLLFYLAYTTGLRLGELEHLMWDDIDFADLKLIVREHLTDKRTIPWTPKDSDRRTVPLTTVAVKMLKKRRSEVQLTSPYIFIDGPMVKKLAQTWNQGDRIIHNMTTTMRRVLSKAGISKGCFHDFRVSAICNWLNANVPPTEVQAMAGHADIQTTINHYTLIDTAAIDRARAVAEAVSRGVNTG